MYLSRLIHPKPNFRFRKMGLPQPIRWKCSTATKPESEKRSTALRAQKASAVESFVKKYMESHPGIFPSVALVRNEIGGSWYTLRDIVLNLKETMMENPGVRINHPSSVDAASDSNSPNKGEAGASGESSLSNEEAPAFGDSGSHLLDSEKLVDAKNDLFQFEELSELITDVSRDQKMKHQLTSTWQDVAAKKSGSPESASHAERNFKALNAKLNLGSEIGESFGLSSQYLEGKGLAKLVAKYVDDMPAVNPKQSAKATAGSLSKFKTDHNLNSPQLPKDHCVPIASSKTLQEPSTNVTNSTGYKTPQFDIESESSELTGADFLLKGKDHPEARYKMMTQVKSDILTPVRLDDSSSSSQKKVVGKSFNISTLINCLRELPVTEQGQCVPHDNTDFTSKDRLCRDLMGEVLNLSEGKLQQYDDEKRQTVLKGQPVREKESGLEISSKVSHATKTKDEDSVDVAAVSALDNIKSTSSAKGSLSLSENDFNKATVASSIEQVLDQNKALLRFLPENTDKSDIAAALKNYDGITKIEFSSVKKGKLKTAYVYFKTMDKLQKVLKRNYLVVGTGNRDAIITIEAASSLDGCKLPDRICIPNLIGDPDAPVVLLKNPTKTVMVRDLTDDMSSHHIREALLASCKSNISGFFLGSSTSVAYVEFETEEGKDRALAEHLIFVQGKPLSIFRVDAPRTTVIRVSGPQKTFRGGKQFVDLCKSFGKVKHFYCRCPHVFDVRYDISEWTNMLKILNRLNGMLFDGHKLQAQPAPVFHPEVILALWNQPEERRLVKASMQKLMQKLQQSDADITGLIELGARYYRDDGP